MACLPGLIRIEQDHDRRQTPVNRFTFPRIFPATERRKRGGIQPRAAMWSASTAASSPTPDRKAEFIFDSHCRPRKYRPGTSVMPPRCTGSPLRIEHGNIDPAEIDAVAGGPDHRADAFSAEVEALQAASVTQGGIGQHRTRGGFFRANRGRAASDMGVQHVEEGRIIGIARSRDSRRDRGRYRARRRAPPHPPEQRDAVGGEAAEVDGVAAIGARDRGIDPVRPALLRRHIKQAHRAEPPGQIRSRGSGAACGCAGRPRERRGGRRDAVLRRSARPTRRRRPPAPRPAEAVRDFCSGWRGPGTAG